MGILVLLSVITETHLEITEISSLDLAHTYSSGPWCRDTIVRRMRTRYRRCWGT